MFALPPPFLMPPARYMQVDAPSIVRQVPFADLANACSEPRLGERLGGCAIPATADAPCIIIIPTPKTWPGTPETLDMARRHEQGHCNGWPADHPR